MQIEALNFENQKGKKIKRKRENKRDSNSTIGIPAVPIAIFENRQLKVQWITENHYFLSQAEIPVVSFIFFRNSNYCDKKRTYWLGKKEIRSLRLLRGLDRVGLYNPNPTFEQEKALKKTVEGKYLSVALKFWGKPC